MNQIKQSKNLKSQDDHKVKHLFSPWRMEYVSSSPSKENVFLDAIQSSNDRESLVLFRGKECFVIMNLYPYNNGHLMIVPYRKVSTMIELSQNELEEIINLAKKSMNIIKDALSADGFNFGVNIGKCAGAGIDDHVHFHVVPRWNGDNNFMPVVGNTKIVVQGLHDTYDALHLHFEKIS